MHPRHEGRRSRLDGLLRSACSLAIVLAVPVACGDTPEVDDAPEVNAVDVERCLSDELGTEGWSEVPLSETGTVYGVDFGPNSVLLYVEPDATAVRDQIRSIREAEVEFGNTSPSDRVILRDRANVLVSWANEPTAEQRSLAERCVGFS